MKPIHYLKENGTIALVAPSFGCASDPYKTRLEAAIANFKADGFRLIKGENIFLSRHKVRSNTARKCAKEFMEHYLSPDSDAVISVGGGELMCEILPYIDFGKIRKAPHKFFMGFSDNTNLTYTLATISEVPTIYGPCFPSYGLKPYRYHVEDALNLLLGKTKITRGYPYWERYGTSGENPLEEKNYSEKKTLRIYPNRPVEATGRLLGGCLDCLVTLCGTSFDRTKAYLEKYRDDGFIWFLEACDLNPVGIQRALFQLKEAGWFDHCRAFLLGRPLCYRKRVFGITHYRAIKEALGSLRVPIVMDADLGHFAPSMPIITGALGTLKAFGNDISIEYPEI